MVDIWTELAVPTGQRSQKHIKTGFRLGNQNECHHFSLEGKYLIRIKLFLASKVKLVLATGKGAFNPILLMVSIFFKSPCFFFLKKNQHKI